MAPSLKYNLCSIAKLEIATAEISRFVDENVLRNAYVVCLG